MKMIMRTNCSSSDSAWARSFFSSTGTNRTSGSLSFSQKYYQSANLRFVRSLSSTFSWGPRSMRSYIDGLGARISWMESWT